MEGRILADGAMGVVKDGDGDLEARMCCATAIQEEGSYA
jgi:hypothetical protein